MKSSAEANTRNQLDNSTVYYHRLNRRIQLEYVSLSGVTELAAADSKHRLIRRPGLNSVGSTGDRRRFNRQNQKLTSVQLSRGATKRTKSAQCAPVKPTCTEALRRFNRRATTDKAECRAPVQPALGNLYTPVERSKLPPEVLTPVDPMLVKAKAPVHSTEMPKTLATEPCMHRLIRRP